MPRLAALVDTLPARIRRYFGLEQAELARFLDVSAAQASRLEAGRRGPSPAVQALLDVLAGPLPPGLPPSAAADAPAPADLGTPDPAPLRARLDDCQQQARRLRRQLRPLLAAAVYAGRWRAALPGLLAALPPPLPDAPPGGPDPEGPGGWAAYLAWDRPRWLARRPPALPPDQSARYHLLRLRAEALEAEAAALAGLL